MTPRGLLVASLLGQAIYLYRFRYDCPALNLTDFPEIEGSKGIRKAVKKELQTRKAAAYARIFTIARRQLQLER